jgi:hypothetical protein
MRFFRYRRPSWKNILGITRAKRRIKKQVGITSLLKPFRFYGNQKRRVLRKLGYESEPMRMLRGGLRKPGGCSLLFIQFLSIAFCTTVAAAIPMSVHRSMLVRAFAETVWGRYMSGVSSGEVTATTEN